MLHPILPTVPRALALSLSLVVCACSDDGGGEEHGHEDDGHDHDNEESEVINVVELHFTPQGGGETVSATFRDPDGDGAAQQGTSELIVLATSTTYTFAVTFRDDLSDPPEDITEEIEEEAEEHQIFVFGSAVRGPASTSAGALVRHEYADVESDYTDDIVGDDLPVGLRNEVVTLRDGFGKLSVQLQHLPELNGEPQKVPGLAEAFANDERLPGGVDALVTFDLRVQD